MKNPKFAALAAALAISGMLGTPTFAALSQDTLVSAEAAVNAGDVAALKALVEAYPELASLPGAVGDKIRGFAANPTLKTLSALKTAELSKVGTSAKASANAGVNSIY